VSSEQWAVGSGQWAVGSEQSEDKYMKIAIPLLTLTLAVSMLCVSTLGVSTLAASALGTLQTSNDPMNTFWAKFKAAVIKGDKEAVFGMSALPVELEYQMPRIRTKAQFMKYYKHMFAGEANAAKCFQTAKPEIDTTNKKLFSVGCPFAESGGGDEPLVYTFKLTRAGWRFVGYDNINE